MNTKWIVAGFIASALMLGCGEKEDEAGDAEACEHLKDGPSVAVTAATTSGNAPAIDSDHKRYDVALVDITGGSGGFVKYAASESTDFAFFFNTDVPVSFLDSTNTEVAPEETAKSSTACGEIKARYVVPLEVGTYFLSFAATTQPSVGIVVEEAVHVE